jgi:hypothetical protein
MYPFRIDFGPIPKTKRFDLSQRSLKLSVQGSRILTVALQDSKSPRKALGFSDCVGELVEPACPLECASLISGTVQVQTPPQAAGTMHWPLPTGCHLLRFGRENGLTFLHYARYCCPRSVVMSRGWTHGQLSEQQPKPRE